MHVLHKCALKFLSFRSLYIVYIFSLNRFTEAKNEHTESVRNNLSKAYFCTITTQLLSTVGRGTITLQHVLLSDSEAVAVAELTSRSTAAKPLHIGAPPPTTPGGGEGRWRFRKSGGVSSRRGSNGYHDGHWVQTDLQQ